MEQLYRSRKAKLINFPRFLRNFRDQTSHVPITSWPNNKLFQNACSDISNFRSNNNFTYIPPQPSLSSNTVRPPRWRYVTATIIIVARNVPRSVTVWSETETLWPVFSISRYPFKNRLENPPSNVLQILLPANLDGPQRAVKVRAWILLARRWNYDRSVVQCALEEQHGDNTACVKFTLAILSVSSSC